MYLSEQDGNGFLIVVGTQSLQNGFWNKEGTMKEAPAQIYSQRWHALVPVSSIEKAEKPELEDWEKLLKNHGLYYHFNHVN